MNADNRNSTCR